MRDLPLSSPSALPPLLLVSGITTVIRVNIISFTCALLLGSWGGTSASSHFTHLYSTLLETLTTLKIAVSPAQSDLFSGCLSIMAVLTLNTEEDVMVQTAPVTRTVYLPPLSNVTGLISCLYSVPERITGGPKVFSPVLGSNCH